MAKQSKRKTWKTALTESTAVEAKDLRKGDTFFLLGDRATVVGVMPVERVVVRYKLRSDSKTVQETTVSPRTTIVLCKRGKE